MQHPWITKPDAPLPKLERQLEGAREAHAAATAALDRARADFDRDPSPKAERSVLDATGELSSMTEHVQRAERLLQAAREREAADRHRRVTARLLELRELLTHPKKQAARGPSLAAEVAALVAAAEAWGDRVAVEKQLGAYEHEIFQIGIELHPNDPPRPSYGQGSNPSDIDLRNAIEELVRTLDIEDPRRAYLQRIVTNLR